MTTREELYEKLQQNRIEYESIMRQLMQLERSEGEHEAYNIERAVVNHLGTMNLPKNFMGYQYLKFGLISQIKYPELDMYREISKEFEVSNAEVKHTLQKLFDLIYGCSDVEKLEEFIGLPIASISSNSITENIRAMAKVVVQKHPN